MPTPIDELPAHTELGGSDRALLLTRGFYRDEPEPAHRSALFELGPRLELLADVWLPEDQRPRVRERLADRCHLRTGEWDVMAQTDWTYAWTHDDAPFAL
jgi:hypothetical protein